MLKNSSSLVVAKKLKFFNANEFIEKQAKILKKKNISSQPLGTGRMRRSKFSVPFTEHQLSFIPFLCYSASTYRVGLGDEPSNDQSP